MDLVVGIVLLVVGFGLSMWVEKRKMERTTPGGVETFNSYGSVWVAIPEQLGQDELVLKQKKKGAIECLILRKNICLKKQ